MELLGNHVDGKSAAGEDRGREIRIPDMAANEDEAGSRIAGLQEVFPAGDCYLTLEILEADAGEAHHVYEVLRIVRKSPAREVADLLPTRGVAEHAGHVFDRVRPLIGEEEKGAPADRGSDRIAQPERRPTGKRCDEPVKPVDQENGMIQF